MTQQLDNFLPAILCLGAAGYMWLGVHVSRLSTGSVTNSICYFLFLIGFMAAGSGVAYGTIEPTTYGIGRTLTLFSAGFLPVLLYKIYREFTGRKTSGYLLGALSIIPILTTALAVTNQMHHLVWSYVEVDGVIRFTEPDQHTWFKRVHAPFAYGLYAFSLMALAGRLPTIALAHRKKVIVLLTCAALPFVVSFANTVLHIGPIDFPFTSATLVLMLPVNWWLAVSQRVQEFSPLAYHTLFDHVRDPIIVLDNSQCILSANSPAQELLKASEQKLIGQKLWQDVPEARAMLSRAGEGDLTQTLRMDTNRYFELSSAPLTGPDGVTRGTVVVCHDVTERKRALKALADSEHLIRSLVEQSSNGILRFALDTDNGDKRFRCVFANRSAERHLESGRDTLVGMPLDKLGLLEPEKLLSHFHENGERRASTSYEIEVERDEGNSWLRVIGEPVGADMSVTLIDITQRKRDENKILADAMRDPLTGILNRRGFEKLATEAIANNDKGAVLYFDLNQFKQINDRFGHQAGDALLKAFGHRLEFCLRPNDILARLGGDEFAIVLPGISREDAKHVARRLVEAAFEAYIIQGGEIECTASVGIALMPEHGHDLWHLVAVADQAMYRSKQISNEDAANDKAAYVEAAISS